MSFGISATPSFVNFRNSLCHLGRSFSVEALCDGDVAGLAREALAHSGKLAQRRSPLQPLFVFWFVVCLPIFRSDSIPALFDRLVLALRGRVQNLPLRGVTDGALAHARRRLGVNPLRRFFRALASSTSPTVSFHGRRVLSIDGVRLNLPDTPANERIFGRPKTSRGRAAFPQLLLVVLLEAVTRLPLDMKAARCDGSERHAASRLLRSVGEGDLVLIDRGFYGLAFFLEIQRRGAHLLCRAPRHAKLEPIGGRKAKRAGDYRAIMQARVPLAPGEQGKTKTAKTKVVELEVRVIEYCAPGFRPVRLVTTLLDESVTAEELIALYHQRWESELAYDEAKTVMLSTAKGTLATGLRSKTPRGVFQEIYALLASYWLVRKTIASAAESAGLASDKISFTDALRVIRQSVTRMSAAPATDLLRLHRQMLLDIAACRLDRPRRPRRYPRVVKRKVGNFALKRQKHRELQPCDPVAAFRAQFQPTLTPA